MYNYSRSVFVYIDRLDTQNLYGECTGESIAPAYKNDDSLVQDAYHYGTGIVPKDLPHYIHRLPHWVYTSELAKINLSIKGYVTLKFHVTI